jgi:hypothetical protein
MHSIPFLDEPLIQCGIRSAKKTKRNEYGMRWNEAGKVGGKNNTKGTKISEPTKG